MLLFIAGHGVNDGPSYRFLATNAERSGDTFRASTVVPWQILQEAIETAKGRRILFLDTCHSGNAYNQQARQRGLSRQHHRLYGRALRPGSARGRQARARPLHLRRRRRPRRQGQPAAKREISTKELADYVVKRVDQLAKAMKGEQEPQYFKGRDAEDYVLMRW